MTAPNAASVALAPWQGAPKPTAWVDPDTGHGIAPSGGALTVEPSGRRKRPALVDLLDATLRTGAQRVYLTGPRRPEGWLFVELQRWEHLGHHVDPHGLDVGRYRHVESGRTVTIARAASWYGEGDYSPAEARQAHELLAAHYGPMFRWGGVDAPLHDSPSQTGVDAWVRTLADVKAPPAQLDEDTAHLVRSTSPQHRVELFTHAGQATLPGFAYMDGRYMYAALTRELGTGPGLRLNATDAEHLFRRAPYARARFLVRAQVPDDWDHVGLLMAQHDGSCSDRCCPDVAPPATPAPGWHAPRRPGTVVEAWVDSAELHLAANTWEWPVQILEGIEFAKGRPLDTWTDRLTRLRERVKADQDAPEIVRDLASGALRRVLLYSIGAFHSTGRRITRVSASSIEAPREAVRHGELWVWHEHQPLTGRALALTHPEWSSQVWGRAHARILECPVPGGKAQAPAGALAVPFDMLLGIRGDALYATYPPPWGDDGKVGRLRGKGWLPGPVKAPRSFDQLNTLRARAERAGWPL